MLSCRTFLLASRRFVRHQSGSTTVFSVVMTLLILIVAGAAVDIMRFEATRALLQTTMDRAVLAAADLDQDQGSETVVQDYLAKAGLKSALSGVTSDTGLNFRTVNA
jgi:Flp pilus assembly protein TadG